jgi:hypothetical protein
MNDADYDHSRKAGNEGDVIKHAFLLDTLDRLLMGKKEGADGFWYVDTHAARPYHRLPATGRWSYGIGKLRGMPDLPPILANYLSLCFYEDDSVKQSKPHFKQLVTRLYLGSSAIVHQRAKQTNPRLPLAMTLFDIDTDTALALYDYFGQQQVAPVMTFMDHQQLSNHVFAALNDIWISLGQSKCLVIKGSSYDYLGGLCLSIAERHPDLVLVDPHRVGEEREAIENILHHCQQTKTAFLCWTPLQAVPDKEFSSDGWSFTHHDDEKRFVETCQRQGYRIAWFAWGSVRGGKQSCYGCQLTFDASCDPIRLRAVTEQIRGVCQEAGIRTQQGQFRVRCWPE